MITFNAFCMIQQHFSKFFKTFVKLKMVDLISWGNPVLQNVWIIWSPFLHFHFRNLEDQNFLSFIRFQWILHNSAVLFSVFQNFFKLNRGDLIAWGEPILQNGWIILSALLYFDFRNLKEPDSWSFIRIQCIQHQSAVLVSVFKILLKLKRGSLSSWGEPILQNSWIIWSSILYFNFRNLKEPNFLSLIRFQCILHDSAVLFSAVLFSN